MRVLTAMGMCNEDGENLYSANPVTLELASPGFSGGVRFMYVYHTGAVSQYDSHNRFYLAMIRSSPQLRLSSNSCIIQDSKAQRMSTRGL